MPELYNDPTFHAAARLEMEDLRNEGCAVCVHRGHEVFDGRWTCGEDKRHPQCLKQKGGFRVDESAGRNVA